VDPATAAAELDKIRKENGGRLDAAILARSVGVRSVLSPLFETDAATGLRLWREHQARRVMGSLWDATNDVPYLVSYKVERVEDADEPDDDASPPMRQYVPLSVLKSRPDIEAQVMAEIVGSLTGLMRKYGQFAKYLKVRPVLKLIRLAIEKAK
jgi:hypothetical protein